MTHDNVKSMPPDPVAKSAGIGAEPPRDCAVCPRLVAFRGDNRLREPGWFNAPVPSFGDPSARLLIVGLAPGLKGANRTGRPFTGDFAGDLLYDTLQSFGFSRGRYEARPDDGLELIDCMITNAVRCVPPENKPTPAEIVGCRPHLSATIAALPRVRVILALGRIAHDQTVAAQGLVRSSIPFAHGAMHDLANGRRLADSFHCSRYNTSTRRLTPDMFRDVFKTIRGVLESA